MNLKDFAKVIYYILLKVVLLLDFVVLLMFLVS